MRLQRRSLRASLLLAFTFTAWPQLGAAANDHAIVKRDPLPAVTHTTSTAIVVATALTQLDKDVPLKDAPVDGKDGRPHAGPFVETAAERDRKKLKDSGEDDTTGTGKKPGVKSKTNKDGALPESNGGVMDDKSRSGPKDGQRGTEGGISEKSKEKAKEKKPEEPTEAPPLPHSEQTKLKTGDKVSDKEDSKAKSSESDAKSEGKMVATPKDKDDKTASPDAAGLSKPADLPDKPHDIPHPIPVGSDHSDALKVNTLPVSGKTPTSEDEGAIIRPFHSFILSLTMIIFSEIGDKTFLVAALMAMKHPPLFVFSAALPALAVMTVGSAVMGHAAPMLLPVKFTHFAAAVLFLIFGVKMVQEGRAMSPNDGVGEEMREVESELEEKEAEAARFNRRNSNANLWALEGGRKARVNSNRLPAPPDSPPESPDGSRSRSPIGSGSAFSSFASGAQNLFSLLLSPAWVQTFVMTFLGEWGDRSQIATIAMAAGQHYWMVTLGALVGHSICTGIAVIGGRAIAGRVSMRTVTLGGAIAFIVFGFIYLAEAIYNR